MTDRPRVHRVEQNESTFRAAEEQSNALALLPGISSELVCECDRPDCTQRLQVPATEYERVRAAGERYIVAAGHERPTERIIERGQGWVAVERISEADEVTPTTTARGDLR
jgi:hypothetical protein